MKVGQPRKPPGEIEAVLKRSRPHKRRMLRSSFFEELAAAGQTGDSLQVLDQPHRTYSEDGIERLASWAHGQRIFIKAQKVQPKGR